MKALIITYHFPPDGAIGGVRPYQLARHLPECGVESWVLTVQPQHAEQLNHDRSPQGVPDERIFRTGLKPTVRDRVLGLWRVASTRPQAVSTAADSVAPGPRRLGSARDWAGSWLSFPDRWIGWLRPAVREAETALQSIRFDVLVSTSPPRVAALVARELSLRHGIPWVMDLRDPWQLGCEGSGTGSWTVRALLALRFRQCVRSAQLVVHNSERLRQQTCRLVPGSAPKTFCIPNGFEPEWVDLPPETNSTEFRIGYYGSIVGNRSGSTFLEGFRRWLRSRRDTDGVRARIVGPGSEAVGLEVARLGLTGNVEVRPPLTRAEVMGLIAEDYVLAILANDQPLQVPGKSYDYLATGRRILAVTERDGATADLFAPLACCRVADGPNEVAAALESFYRDFTQGLSAYVERPDWLAEAAYPRRVSRYAELLRSVVRRPPRVA